VVTYNERIEDVIVIFVVHGDHIQSQEKNSELTRRGWGEVDDPRWHVVVVQS